MLISASEAVRFCCISYNHRISQTSPPRLGSFYPLPSTATNRRIHVISRTWTVVDRLNWTFWHNLSAAGPLWRWWLRLGTVSVCRTVFLSEHCTFCQSIERDRQSGGRGAASCANFAPVLLIAHSPQALWEIIKIAFENAVCIEKRRGEGKM